MCVAIISSNQALQKALQSAFSGCGITYQVLADIDDGDNIDLIISDTAFPKEYATPIFLLSDGSRDDTGQFARVFQFPLRFGVLCDEISYFLRQKTVNKQLKPVMLGRFTLYPDKNELKDDKDSVIKVTDKELSILLFLGQQHPKKVARAKLLDHVWQYADNVETHTLETHIYRLRQKIEQDPAIPSFLMTDDDGYYLNL